MSADAAELSRLRRAFNRILPTDRPRSDCPPAERIWEAVRGDLAPQVFRKTIQHVAACPVCTEAWRLAEELETEPAPSREAEVLSQGAAVRRPAWLPLAGVAAAILAAAVGLQMFLSWRTEQGAGADPPPISRGSGDGSISLLTESPLSRQDPVLLWRGPQGSESYDLQVMDLSAMHLRIDASGLAQPKYELPPEVLAQLSPGAPLWIRIEALNPVGDALDSATFELVVE